MEKRLTQFLLLALAVVLTLFTGLPTADVPVKVYDNAFIMVYLCSVLAVAAAWLYLAASDRRRRDWCIAFALNLLVVLFLWSTLSDIYQCYEYYFYGGG